MSHIGTQNFTRTQAWAKLCLYTPDRNGMGIPLFVHGYAGGGKTSQLASLGRALGFDHVLALNTMNIHETEPGGLATRQPDGLIEKIPFKNWVQERTLIILDEMASALHVQQTSWQTVVSERRMGTVSLPSHAFILAGNMPTEVGRPLTTPLANRCVHIVHNTTNQERANYRTGVSEDITQSDIFDWYQKIRPSDKSGPWRKVLRAMWEEWSDILDDHPELNRISAPDGEVDPFGSITDPRKYAFTTERSWESAIRLLSVEKQLGILKSAGVESPQSEILQATLGEAATMAISKALTDQSKEWKKYVLSGGEIPKIASEEDAHSAFRVSTRYSDNPRALDVIFVMAQQFPEVLKASLHKWPGGSETLKSLFIQHTRDKAMTTSQAAALLSKIFNS